MPIKTYRPVTPTRRFQTVTTRDEITKQKPEKSLVESKKRTGGRNSTGRVTSRFIGGGAKQAYRVVDFKRDKAGIPCVLPVQLEESLREAEGGRKGARFRRDLERKLRYADQDL